MCVCNEGRGGGSVRGPRSKGGGGGRSSKKGVAMHNIWSPPSFQIQGVDMKRCIPGL